MTSPSRSNTHSIEPTNRPWTRRVVVASAAAGAAVLALPPVAMAHVTVQPESVDGGGFAVVAFRVPTERENASTVKVRVVFPEDQPVGSVRTTPVPGWRVATRNRTLEEPIEMFGEQVSEVVSQVTWTATGKGIAPGQFQDFDVSLGPLPDSGEMVFAAVQTYSSGERVTWNEVAVDESVEPEHPAPVLTITPPAAEGSGAEAARQVPAGETSGAADSREAAGEQNGDGSPGSALPVTLSSAALLVSLAALLVAWRRRPA